MFYAEGVLIFDIPNQKALVVGLAVILLNGAAAIPHASFCIKNLISLVNVPEHCEVVTGEDANVMVAMIHHPASVSLDARYGAVIKCDVDTLRVARGNPDILIKYRKYVEREIWLYDGFACV